uniref:Uncharacterized protein n=1 Tax=Lepeophtheirus salmonis TaxID=72036 RepID=A0A0K2U8Q9_LEPSM
MTSKMNKPPTALSRVLKKAGGKYMWCILRYLLIEK